MTDNVKNAGVLYVTSCTPPPPGHLHQLGLVYFTFTREYEWPFRSGRGIGIRLPKLLIARGGDGHWWFRFTSRVRVIGLWFGSKRRREWDEDQGLVWALKAVAKDADGDEISNWVTNSEGVLAEQ